MRTRVRVLIFSGISVLSSTFTGSLTLLSRRVNRKPRWPLGGDSAVRPSGGAAVFGFDRPSLPRHSLFPRSIFREKTTKPACSMENSRKPRSTPIGHARNAALPVITKLSLAQGLHRINIGRSQRGDIASQQSRGQQYDRNRAKRHEMEFDVFGDNQQ